MIAGKMDKYIRVEVGTSSENDVGTPAKNYVLLRYIYMSVFYGRSGTDFDEAAHPFTYTEFTGRWMSDLDSYNNRFKFEDEYYKILHIEKIGRHEGLRFKCILWDSE